MTCLPNWMIFTNLRSKTSTKCLNPFYCQHPRKILSQSYMTNRLSEGCWLTTGRIIRLHLRHLEISHGYPKLYCGEGVVVGIDVNKPYSKPQFPVLPFPKHDSLMVISVYFPTICICKENFKHFTLTIATGHLQDRCCWRCRPPDIVKIMEPLVMWIETTPKFHCPISSNRHSVIEWWLRDP